MISTLTKLQSTRLIPVGVHVQWTIDGHGIQKNKQRLTHDYIFELVSGHYINSDTANVQLGEYRYEMYKLLYIRV